MEELKSWSKAWDVETLTEAVGQVVILKNKGGISPKGAIAAPKGGTVIAAYAYHDDQSGLYDVVYIHLDGSGSLIDTQHEQEGVLPELFHSPDGAVWVSLGTTSGKELDIALPLYGRSEHAAPKGTRPFPGKYAASFGTLAWFHDEDWFSEKKPDRLLRLEFADGSIQSNKVIKLPMPKNNKISLDPEGRLGLLAVLYQEEELLHRTLDGQGGVIEERRLSGFEADMLQVLELGSERDMRVIFTMENKLSLGIIAPDGRRETHALYELQSPFYSMWEPMRLADGTDIIRFTFEEGNGWAIVQNKGLRAIFTHSGERGYTNRLTGELLPIPSSKPLVLNDICRVSDQAYRVIVYPMMKGAAEARQLFIAQLEL
ncbi:hypothetical protein SAMN04487969_11796 [Paenibacillus algorifonticola]|uniref:Uncharacterized protein n=1 Tax=Paenibacillus algorifonticola TaxID=684063 RepID=A0A1I2GT33_9BACL|nr:hypothetical protein [Paenibacillus algorifonticola]SFF19816.1 hypothetical protein SAMN04487969_11796 [Paenibacillus algorifonticola]